MNVSTNKETMQERMERLKREKEEAQKNNSKSTVISQLTHEADSTTDFEKITEEFQKLQENKQPGANEGYTKDTIYIKDSLYKAFNTLCVNRGDKKKHVNAAIEDYVLKQYREMKAKK